MTENKWKLPSALRSRKGWSSFLELKRSFEPHLHQIEPTNACPYSCIMCPRDKFMSRPVGFMDFALYAKVIDEVASFSSSVREKEVELFHFGESLLHPEIAEMVAYGVGRGLNLVLSVNAPQLTPELAEKIITKDPVKLIISMDGYDAESYREIRGKNADYSLAVEHLETLLKMMKRNGSRSRVIVRMIRMQRNYQGEDQFRTRWQELGGEVEVRDFFPWNKKELIPLGTVEKYPPHMPCPFPWQYLVVQWNGDVVPCCRDFNAVNCLGNVTNLSLKEIWNSTGYEQFRESMSKGEFEPSMCAECMEIYGSS
jgi:radical SAM protein with 4Fe4S-binding SPASM domain